MPQMFPWGASTHLHAVEHQLVSRVSGNLSDAPAQIRARLQPLVDQHRARGKAGEMFVLREGSGESKTYKTYTAVDEMSPELQE